MIETITIRGNCGAFDPAKHFLQLRALDLKSFLSASGMAFKMPVLSPLVAAEINATSFVRLVHGKPTLFVEMDIPLSLAICGHNVFHDTIESLPRQLECVSGVAKLVLLKIGMWKEEVRSFLSTLQIRQLRAVWYCVRSSDNPSPTAEKLQMVSLARINQASAELVEERLTLAGDLAQHEYDLIHEARLWVEQHQRADVVFSHADLADARIIRVGDLTTEAVSSLTKKKAMTIGAERLNELGVVALISEGTPLPPQFHQLTPVSWPPE